MAVSCHRYCRLINVTLYSVALQMVRAVRPRLRVCGITQFILLLADLTVSFLVLLFVIPTVYRLSRVYRLVTGVTETCVSPVNLACEQIEHEIPDTGIGAGILARHVGIGCEACVIITKPGFSLTLMLALIGGLESR